MEARLKLLKDGKEDEGNSSQFISLIGSLRYLINTQHDITYSVNYVRRYMNKPSSQHMSAAKRILRYIKGTSSFRLRYERTKKNYSIQGFSDSDFVGDSDYRKSTTSQSFFMGNFAITWTTVKQYVVMLSSYEAEYIATSAASCQGIWII